MRRKKLFLRLGIVLGILVAFYAVLRITGGLLFFNIQSNGNSPGIEPNDYIFVSSWVSYERLDLVCYYGEDPTFGPGEYVHRLCGISGDTVQIIEGDLFVNGKNVDENLNVKHNYIVPPHTSFSVRQVEGVEYVGSNPDYLGFSDSVILAIESDVLESKFEATRIPNTQTKVHQQFPSDWTMNNFGPVILSDGEVFFLGDNRDNSIDSRSYGLANERDIIGVVLNKD